MALNFESLQTQIYQSLEKTLASVPEGSKDESKKIYRALATELALAIDAYVRSATVITTVNTTGTATNQTGTGIGNST